jgi:hypothetical protein
MAWIDDDVVPLLESCTGGAQPPADAAVWQAPKPSAWATIRSAACGLVHVWSTCRRSRAGSRRSATVRRSCRSLVGSCGNRPGCRTLIRMRSWWIDRARSPARCGLCVGGWDPSTVEVAAPPSAVGLGPELAFQLHEAPDPGAIGTDVWLDLRGRFAQAGQVDAEQRRAPFQRRRDRPSQARVVPGPHRPRLSNTSSKPNPQSCVPRERSRSGCMGRAEAEPGMGCRHSLPPGCRRGATGPGVVRGWGGRCGRRWRSR